MCKNGGSKSNHKNELNVYVKSKLLTFTNIWLIVHNFYFADIGLAIRQLFAEGIGQLNINRLIHLGKDVFIFSKQSCSVI